MNKNILYSSLLLVVLFNLLIIRKHKALSLNFENYTHQVNRAKIYRDIQLESFLKFENTPIEIEEIKESELCYVVSKLHCNQCVDSILTVIQNFEKEHEAFHFRILAKYESQQDLHLFKRLHGINSSIISISELDFPIVDSEVPLLFIYDPDIKKAQKVFTPDPDDSGLTLKYLSLLNMAVSPT